MQCPPDFPAVGVMVMISGLVGRRISVCPKRLDDWRVTPNLWGFVVGRPGSMKTPALEEVLRPLQAAQLREMAVYEAAMMDFKAETYVREQRERVRKDRIKAAVKKNDDREAEAIAHEVVAAEADEPVCVRYLVNDATVEKLGEIMAHNPLGLVLYRDELNGFFRTLARQGHENDRAFYLESWNGDGSYVYDRIGRGTICIPSVCLAVLGSIQPAPLGNLVREMRNGDDDGLLQRFQLAVWPDQSKEWRNIDRPPDKQASDEVAALVDRLTSIRQCTEPLRFGDAAQRLFDDWRAHHEHRLRGDLHPIIEAHLSKYRKLVPALALLCHVADPSAGFAGSISEESVARAIAWADYLEPHAVRIYAPAISPDLDAARFLAARVSAGDIADSFALKDVYNNGWTGLGDRDIAAAAVKVLIDYDWLREDREQTSGRTRTVYTINPLVRKK
jgi:putative DNA primase/helicase